MTLESIIIIFLALAAGSLIKGISGLGLPLVAIPIMAGFMAVDRAVAIMILPGLGMNFYLIWTFRKHAVNFASLPLMIAVGVAGIITGAWILSRTPEVYLLSFLAIWLGGYLLSMLVKSEAKFPEGFTKHAPALVVGFAGIVQGAIGTAGPVLAPYVHSLKLKRQEFHFVVSVLFQIFAVAQFFAFLWFGMFTLERAYLSAMACIPVAIFLPLALWIANFQSQAMFNRCVIVMLVVIEARLLWRLLS
ncbi:MAG: hypothetical protein CMM52_05645 [Rhodospirillaceae bacterium]|nr:hypothetical protein [Rhodospirillaceae bacterium]|tara:strand:- start:2612 stop:3352 length:741 start_codon:yes stop_codon:yes gene_type:complete